MPSPTPEPDYALLVDTLSLVAPRLDLFLRELKRRLLEGFPHLVAAANASGAYAIGGKPLPGLAGVRYGGTPSSSGQNKDWVYLALETHLVPTGLACEFDTLATLSIHVLGEKQEVDEQGEAAQARAGLILRYLHEFMGGCCDGQGRKAWHHLVPQGGASLPASFGAYSGTTLTYEVRLTPDTF